MVMSFYDKVNGVIGQPYDKFKNHCWHLVEYLVPTAPKLEGTAESLRTSVGHFQEELNKTALVEVTSFKDQDIIVLGRGGTYHHAGVFCNGGVVHADVGGTIWQSLSDIRNIYPEVKGLRS